MEPDDDLFPVLEVLGAQGEAVQPVPAGPQPDPDDEELVNTPDDVVAALGFDPKGEA